MQYILTEQEYSDLKFNINQTISTLQQKLDTLTKEHKELQEKYNNLLVFGVSLSNERLKENKQ